MYFSLIGSISSSRKPSYIGPTLFLTRETTNDISVPGQFRGAEPIVPGTTSQTFAPGNEYVQNYGYSYWGISASGDTSQIYEWGIVSSTEPSPLYPTNSQVLDIGNYLTYSSLTQSGLFYYRSYTVDNFGNFYYSSEPGEQFYMETVNILFYQRIDPPKALQPVEIFIEFELIPSATPSMITLHMGTFSFNQDGNEPNYQDRDPYWTKSMGFGRTYSVLPGNTYSHYINEALDFVGGGYGLFNRISFEVNGITYWSNLFM